MIEEKEASVWCPKCLVDKFDVYRVYVGDGVWTHSVRPPEAEAKYCSCGEILERKNV